MYLGVKTSVETAGEAWYNLLLVSIYFNLLLTLIRSHTVAWRLQFTVCIIYMLQWAVFLLRWDIRWVLLRWFEIYAVFLLRFVLRRGRLHAVYGRGRVRFKRQVSFVNRRRLYFEVEPFHGNVFIHNTFFRIETWFPPVAATSFISIGDVTRARVHHCLELSTRVDIIIGAAAAPIIFSEIRKPCLLRARSLCISVPLQSYMV